MAVGTGVDVSVGASQDVDNGLAYSVASSGEPYQAVGVGVMVTVGCGVSVMAMAAAEGIVVGWADCVVVGVVAPGEAQPVIARQIAMMAIGVILRVFMRRPSMRYQQISAVYSSYHSKDNHVVLEIQDLIPQK
jgi:hypothetical protein